jgi:hypothetical protein
LPDLFGTIYQIGKIYNKFYHNTHIPNGRKIHQYFPLQGPTKYTKIDIFGLKICHLATLDRGNTDGEYLITLMYDQII